MESLSTRQGTRLPSTVTAGAAGGCLGLIGSTSSRASKDPAGSVTSQTAIGAVQRNRRPRHSSATYNPTCRSSPAGDRGFRASHSARPSRWSAAQ
jgi:hypothetical protein